MIKYSALSILLLLTGCGWTFNEDDTGMPFPVGTCFSAQVQLIEQRSVGVYQAKQAVDARYIFILSVPVEKLTPVQCNPQEISNRGGIYN